MTCDAPAVDFRICRRGFCAPDRMHWSGHLLRSWPPAPYGETSCAVDETSCAARLDVLRLPRGTPVL